MLMATGALIWFNIMGWVRGTLLDATITTSIWRVNRKTFVNDTFSSRVLRTTIWRALSYFVEIYLEWNTTLVCKNSYEAISFCKDYLNKKLPTKENHDLAA